MKIYVLIDPRTDAVRYVGVTTELLRKRGYKHIFTRNHTTPRGRWVNSLYDLGLRPTIKQVDEVPDSEWDAAERRWIQHFRDAGCDLVNDTLGGPGFSRPHTEETKRKISEHRKGIKPVRPDKAAWAAAISRGHQGKQKSSEHRAKLAAAQRGKSVVPLDVQDEARRLAASGMSCRAISIRLGFKWDAINRILKRDLVSGTGRELTLDQLRAA